MTDIPQYHPDFVITIGGQDVTQYVDEWTLDDTEKSISTISATIENKDMRFSGKFTPGSDIEFRFGQVGQMSDKISMRLMKLSEKYEKSLMITVTGMDDSQKLTQTQCRGCEKGSPNKIIKKLAEKSGVKNVDAKTSDSEKSKDKMAPQILLQSGINTRDAMFILANNSVSKDAKEGGSQPHDQTDTKTKSGEKGAEVKNAQMQSGLSGKKKVDENRLKNAKNRAKSDTITAEIHLIGYPLLKAKANITVLNVGPFASGDWYVQSVHHTWGKKGGYLTNAKLIRGGLGKKGGKSTPAPVVLYADIYKKDSVYVGPRKTDAASQATFYFGDGNHVLSFNWSMNAQNTRSAGKEDQGKFLNPNNKKKPKDSPSSNKDSGGGSGGSGGSGGDQGAPQIGV